MAKEIARRIYMRYFDQGTTDFEPVKLVFSRISKLIIAELNDEEFTP